jgi:hypothetical protein
MLAQDPLGNMRRAVTFTVTIFVLYAGAAWAFAFPPFSPQPAFYANVEPAGRLYTCNGGMGPNLFIRFEANGRVAIVRAEKRILRLTFEGSSGLDEVYRNGLWRLTLDPEANLIGPNGVSFLNCY